MHDGECDAEKRIIQFSRTTCFTFLQLWEPKYIVSDTSLLQKSKKVVHAFMIISHIYENICNFSTLLLGRVWRLSFLTVAVPDMEFSLFFYSSPTILNDF